MIVLRDHPQRGAAHVDGIVRDSRLPIPDDGLLSGAVVGIGDPRSGPLISMTIEKRLYPRKAPIHLHKSDTFRMAFEQPIVVGRTSYPHGHFRLQRADGLYGPELWSDEVGTNQFLMMADRRGAKPYLAVEEHQHLVDETFPAEMAWMPEAVQHGRHDLVNHSLGVSFGATEHAGHIDGGFSDTSGWSAADDGTRIAVLVMGDATRGPALIALDRPSDARPVGSFRVASDVVRLVVSGASSLGGRVLGRLGFRIVPASYAHDASVVDAGGAQELWVIADRSEWDPVGSVGADAVVGMVSSLIDNIGRSTSD